MIILWHPVRIVFLGIILWTSLSLDYNQLKIRVLELFEADGELDSAQVLRLLAKEKGASNRDKAVEMALLRYWRQGLLARARKGGRFYYKLTGRGVSRREWLTKVMKGPSEA
jgi:DNA-binding transcriptional regulator PaaX